MFHEYVFEFFEGLKRLPNAIERFEVDDRLVRLGWIATAAVLGAVLIYYALVAYRVRSKFQRMQKQGMPMMPHHPILGHLPLMPKIMSGCPADGATLFLPLQIQENWRAVFPEHVSALPPVVYLDLWPFMPPTAMSFSGDVSAQFTQEFNQVKTPEQKRFMMPVSGTRDVTSAEGDDWVQRRKALNPLFSAQNIMAWIPELVTEVEVFLEVLRGKVGSGGGWGPMFQIEKPIKLLTLDMINYFCLSTRFQEQTTTMSVVSSGVLDILSRQAMFLHVGNIWGYYNPWRLFKVWQQQQRMDDFYLPYIRKRFDRRTKEGEAPSGRVDLPQVIFKAAEGRMASEKRKLAFLDVAHDIMGEAKLMVFAGHDTMNFSLASVLDLLMHHATTLERVRAEVKDVLGDRPADRIREDPHLLNALVYTNAVIKETLRVHANVGTLRMGAPGFNLYGPAGSGHEGAVWPVGGIMLFDASSAISRHEAVWPRAAEFLPERWLVDPGHELHPGEYQKNWYRPFEQGPRNCIGQPLAMVELKMVVACVVSEFDVECDWDKWDVACGNVGPKAKKPTYHGRRLYMVNEEGPPKFKDGMPVHVRLRSGK